MKLKQALNEGGIHIGGKFHHTTDVLKLLKKSKQTSDIKKATKRVENLIKNGSSYSNEDYDVLQYAFGILEKEGEF